jgi:outer membrane protein assembly factor BamB
MIHAARIVGLAGLLSCLLSAPAARAGDAPHVSTATPFSRGDILVASTVMNDPTDDHAGIGRIFQYDEEFNLKGELWLEGSTHKVGGLVFGPDKTLWAFAQLTPVVMEIAPDAKQKPVRRFSDRKFSSITFGRDGSLYFGEHMQGTLTGHPAITTKFKPLPGRDVIGDGVIEKFSPDGKLLKTYKTQAHGGLFGFLAVTSTVLSDGDKRMIYVSETGPVIKQYDLANDRQLPDLALFKDDPRVPMVLVMVPARDGNLLITTGFGFLVVDQKTGAIIRHYPIEGRGWAAIAPTVDGQDAIVGNFFTGDVVRVRLDDGVVLKRANIGQKESLSGIAQFPG